MIASNIATAQVELPVQAQAPSRPGTRGPQPLRTLVHGQLVIVYARWLLVLAGLLVALWDASQFSELRLQVGVILAVAIGNFYLHAQLARRRPAVRGVALVASMADLVAISLLVAAQGGFASDLYVFYVPALLAISVAFPTRETAALTGVAMALYAIAIAGWSVQGDVAVLRLIAFAGVAFVGNAYWRLHAAAMQSTGNARQEAAENLFFGQVALMWARWSVIGGAAAFVLLHARSTSELIIGIAPVLVLLAVNFYGHGRYVAERPINRALCLLTTGVDVAMFAALFAAWVGAGTGGLADPLVILAYPTIFAFALVFEPRLSVAFTVGMGVLYALLCLASGLEVTSMLDVKMLVVRLITLGAAGGLGVFYWRMVRRGWRRDARAARSSREDASHAMAA